MKLIEILTDATVAFLIAAAFNHWLAGQVAGHVPGDKPPSSKGVTITTSVLLVSFGILLFLPEVFTLALLVTLLLLVIYIVTWHPTRPATAFQYQTDAEIFADAEKKYSERKKKGSFESYLEDLYSGERAKKKRLKYAKIAASSLLTGLIGIAIWQLALVPLLRKMALEEEIKRQAIERENSFKPSPQRLRTTAKLEARESHEISCPTRFKYPDGYWTGISEISACLILEVNNLFVKEWCPGEVFTLRDVAADTHCETLKISALDEPVEINLFYDHSDVVPLTPDTPSMTVIVSPGTYVMLGGSWYFPEPKQLSWTPLENCIYVEREDDQGLKACESQTYKYAEHFTEPSIRDIYVRAFDKPARVLFTGVF